MPDNRLPDEEVEVKISICQKCDGIVTVAVSHLMDKQTMRSFYKDVVNHDLLIKQQPLLDYRKEDADWCKCENKVKK
jgi:hypothetical protein